MAVFRGIVVLQLGLWRRAHGNVGDALVNFGMLPGY